MIVLFDTSIFISAMEYGGAPKYALVLAIGKDTLLTCGPLEEEIHRIMCEKFHHDPDRVRDDLMVYLEFAKATTVFGRVSGVCRDPNDDFLLECAVEGGADLIVTGDKDLLSLGEYEGVRIVTAREYLEMA